MELDWSEQSPHIRTLFRPWQDGDGCEEDVITAAEARWGLRVPVTLRSFYRTWGHRRDLTQMNGHLLAPDKWVVHAGALIFCVENQSCSYWAVPLAALAEADPPVVQAESGRERSVWEVEDALEWQTCSQRVSRFLDALTYLHAFAGGAVHGTHSARLRPGVWQADWLEQNWQQVKVRSLQVLCTEENDGWDFPLYVRDGQALEWFDRCDAVANNTEALDEIAHALTIDWEKRW
jgi:hypothetical protein